MSTVLRSSGSQGNEGPAQEKWCMRNKIMHHHVSSGVELMSSQHAKKLSIFLIAVCIFFLLPNLYSFRLTLFGYKKL